MNHLSFGIHSPVAFKLFSNKKKIEVSQPLFLAMIVIGSILSSMGIIPMGVEAYYREDTNNIKAIDAACMATPWLWGMVCIVSLITFGFELIRKRL